MFQIGGVDNPSDTEGQYLTVSTYQSDSGLYQIDSSFEQFFLEFETGVITVESASTNQAEIYSPDGNFTFTFSPQLAMLTPYVLTIRLPRELEVLQNSACNISSNGLGFSQNYSCKADSLLNMITVKNLMTRDVAKGESLQLVVNSIRNPMDYILPGEVEISLETPSGGSIATGKWGGWTTKYSHSFIE